MFDFTAGLISMGFFVVGLFFARFWSRSRDRLFLAFAAAFWLLAANHAIVALFGLPREEQSWVYLLRLAAFLLIIVAIVSKNLAARRGG
ncbi:DUF5985 family protein [Salinarimonas sp.]|uniref:DUF5985 family protein n=1 Tax=Salinarimonas sp. TaxID=2766526 RepID=UPI00391CE31C